MSDVHVKPTLHGHVIEWYCSAIGLEQSREGVKGHFPLSGPQLKSASNLEYFDAGEPDEYGGRVVAMPHGSGHQPVVCICGAFLRRRPLAPIEIKL